jgi:hypothetical protein
MLENAVWLTGKVADPPAPTVPETAAMLDDELLLELDLGEGVGVGPGVGVPPTAK